MAGFFVLVRPTRLLASLSYRIGDTEHVRAGACEAMLLSSSETFLSKHRVGLASACAVEFDPKKRSSFHRFSIAVFLRIRSFRPAMTEVRSGAPHDFRMILHGREGRHEDKDAHIEAQRRGNERQDKAHLS